MEDRKGAPAARTPKTVLLGVTGCIAAYKSCEIVRGLQKRGYRVKVMMTEHAAEFVGPVTFRSLTHEEVSIGLFDHPSDPIHHISLAEEADLILLAPLTANVMAKMACGIADDLFTTTLLAATCPVLIAPAMNVHMWQAAATQENLARLRNRGVAVVEPATGHLACGYDGQGKLAAVEDIVERACEMLEEESLLAGRRVLVTAGPTHEPIDAVRYIANRSSGKMGYALARAARLMGAEVTLVSGPSALSDPQGVRTVRVTTAQEMLAAAEDAFATADLAICAAAVADYTPAHPAGHKLKKTEEHLDHVELVETTDILRRLSEYKGRRIVVGFAAETDNVVSYARDKLARKGCDAIVANDVSAADSTFGSDTNRIRWITADVEKDFPLMSKDRTARAILHEAAALLARTA